VLDIFLAGPDDLDRTVDVFGDLERTKQLDDSIEALGLEVLRVPVASPEANSICGRVIGTIRRECLDWMIPLSEGHLKAILRCWVTHYNRGRPHSALGPAVPGPPRKVAKVPKSQSRLRLAAGVLGCNRCWAGCITRHSLR